MKQIPKQGHSTTTGWDKSLLADLSYIKKHLKYKPKREMYKPVRFWLLLLLIAATLSLIIMLVTLKDGRPNWSVAGLMLVSTSVYIVLIVRFLFSLKFISIVTPYFSQQNQKLVESFLRANHMAIARHPDAPEVFQIQSRNLYADEDYREIMIFVADDKRILINSHFSNGGWSSSKRHHRQMGKKLKKWMENNPLLSDSTDIQVA